MSFHRCVKHLGDEARLMDRCAASIKNGVRV